MNTLRRYSIMPALLAALFQSGLGLIGNAVLAKGKDVIEQKLGIDLSESVKTEAGLLELKRLEFSHQEFLITAAQKAAETEMEAEKTAQNAVTARWTADASGDSYFAKNVRPGVLTFLTVAIVLLAALPLDISDAWISLLKDSYMLVLAAYFVGRSVEKVKSTGTTNP